MAGILYCKDVLSGINASFCPLVCAALLLPFAKLQKSAVTIRRVVILPLVLQMFQTIL